MKAVRILKPMHKQFDVFQAKISDRYLHEINVGLNN